MNSLEERREPDAALIGRWVTVRVTAVAETPILFALPGSVLRCEVPRLPDSPHWVSVLPGALHAAIGRELFRCGDGPEARGWFESRECAAMLLEPPHAPEALVLGEEWARAGRVQRRAQPPLQGVAYAEGERFTFGVCLIGQAMSAEADVVRAVVAAGKRGVGGRVLGERGRYRVVGAVREVEARSWMPPPKGAFRCTFVTPWIGRRTLPGYPELWKACRIRVLHQLDRVHGLGGMRRRGYDRLAEGGIAADPVRSGLERWLLHYDRFRPDDRPSVADGLVGAVEFSACPESHWPVLCLASKMGIGARTSLGFGRLRLEPL